MNVADIEKKLLQGIASIINRNLDSISPDMPFHEIGIDSLGFVEILVYIEKTFNLQLISSELTKKDFENVHLLAQLIARKL
ncbi:MAG: acyl carrier protein [Desulfuromonadales bacterium]|nr:acyl carrier protein [Desulfuromonadales bacterium]